MSSKAIRRTIRARSISNFLDALERRQMFNSTPFVLSGGTLTQNWDDASLIVTTGNWTGVPSIEGYSGSGLTSSTNVDPSTLTAAEASPVIQVAANVTTAPGSYSTGGVSEMQLSAAIGGTGLNTVAFQGSGSSPAPYLKFYLNSTGTQNVRIKYDLIDIDSGANTANQQVALQYRIGSSGVWTNVPAAYVQNASDFASGATGKTTSIDVTLPSNADNAGLVEVRVMTTDAGGSDQLIAIENINISATVSNTSGVFSLEQSAYTVSEGVGNATFTVRRLSGTTGAVSVAYATLNGTAIEPGDYTNTSGVLNFGNGVDSLSFTVPIINDTDVESTENFSVSLSSPTGGATLGSPSTATVSITDNDVAVNFSLEQSSYTVSEGVGSASFVVRRLGGTTGTASVSFSTANGTAVAPGDYTTSSGTLNFLSGVETLSFSVPIINDNDVESSENFTVSLSNPTNGTTLGSPSSATVTITDNDVAGTLAFNPITYSVNENAGSVTLTVERTLGTSGAVSVAWATLAGTAGTPGDFTGNSGVLNFANGEASKTIVIQITDDAAAEGIEQFTVTLSSPGGGALLGAATTATITINDNDTNGPAGLLLNEISVNPPGTNAPYQFVELRGTPNQALADVYLLDIEGDSAQNPGKINGIIPVTATIGANGLLLIGSSAGFVPETVGTGILNSTYFDVGQTGFQQGSNSFVLVFNDTNIGTFSLTVGTDLDTTNSASLTLPSSVSILDAVGTLDGGTTDKAYGAVLGPIGTNALQNAPDAMVRYFSNATPSSAAAWFYGDLAGATNSSKTFSTNTAVLSQPFPAGGILTPGGVMTGVTSVVLDYAGTSQAVLVTFTKDVSASLAASDFELTLSPSGTPVTLTLLGVSPDGKTARLGFSDTGGITSSILVDGDYQLKVKQGQVGDGNDLLPVDHVASIFFKNADFNHDRTVGFDDLLLLAQNYGQTSGATFGGGDVNYDGAVNFDDLLALAQRYGTSLLTLAPVKQSTTVAKKRTGFSSKVIA